MNSSRSGKVIEMERIEIDGKEYYNADEVDARIKALFENSEVWREKYLGVINEINAIINGGDNASAETKHN